MKLTNETAIDENNSRTEDICIFIDNWERACALCLSSWKTTTGYPYIVNTMVTDNSAMKAATT